MFEKEAEEYAKGLCKTCTLDTCRNNTLHTCAIKEYIKQAHLAGLKAGRPQWHKVADGDLPEHEVNVLVLYSVQCIDIAHYNYDYKEWHFTDSIVRDVIAWCEIPKYTEE